MSPTPPHFGTPQTQPPTSVLAEATAPIAALKFPIYSFRILILIPHLSFLHSELSFLRCTSTPSRPPEGICTILSACTPSEHFRQHCRLTPAHHVPFPQADRSPRVTGLCIDATGCWTTARELFRVALPKNTAPKPCSAAQQHTRESLTSLHSGPSQTKPAGFSQPALHTSADWLPHMHPQPR